MSKLQVVREGIKHGVCVWQFDDGTLLGDGDGYLSLDGEVGSKTVEHKMRQAANYWLDGQLEGHPKWIEGARKITQTEYEVQMERMIDGHIPDEMEVIRQVMGG